MNEMASSILTSCINQPINGVWSSPLSYLGNVKVYLAFPQKLLLYSHKTEQTLTKGQLLMCALKVLI